MSSALVVRQNDFPGEKAPAVKRRLVGVDIQNISLRVVEVAYYLHYAVAARIFNAFVAVTRRIRFYGQCSSHGFEKLAVGVIVNYDQIGAVVNLVSRNNGIANVYFGIRAVGARL